MERRHAPPGGDPLLHAQDQAPACDLPSGTAEEPADRTVPPSSAEVAITVDATGRILAVTGAAQTLLDAEPRHLTGYPLSLVLTPDTGQIQATAERHWAHTWAQTQPGGEGRGYLRTLTGRLIPVVLAAHTSEMHGAACVALVVRTARGGEPASPSPQFQEQIIEILEETSDLVSLVDTAGREIYCNRAARTFRGSSDTDENSGFVCLQYPPWAYQLLAREAIPYARRHGIWHGESALLDSTGREHPVSQVVIAHQSADGSPGPVSTIIRDIAHFKQTQERLSAEKRILEIIAEPEVPLDQILATLCGYLDEHTPAGTSHGVLTLDPDSGRLHLIAAPRLPDGIRLRLKPQAVGPDQPGCGGAIYHQETRVIEDIARETDPGSPLRGFLEAGYQASVSKPLLDPQGHPLGTLVTYLETPRELDSGEQALLDTFASLAKLAITRRRFEAEQHFLATHDMLTGLPNRALFMDRMERMLVRARREGSHVAVMFLDLDRFKPINDEFGHEIGDQVLQTLAARIQSHVRETDTVGRHGGDEFILVVGDLRDQETAGAIAEHLIEAINDPMEIGGQPYQVSVSIGIALFPDHGQDAKTLLQAADEAMYKVKRQGPEQYGFASDTWLQ